MDRTPQKLFNRNFLLLWQGQLVSRLGSQAFVIAVMFWLKQETGSGSIMGLYMMCTGLPGLFLGPVGGAVADRFSRKTILITCDIVNGLALCSLAGMVYFWPQATQWVVTWIFCISILVAIMSAFFRPAVAASIPDLAPESKLAAANSLRSGSNQVTMFVGQAVGGTLLRVLGAPLLFFINGLSYLFSAVSECFIEMPQAKPKEQARNTRDLFALFWTDTLEGFRYAWKEKGLRVMLLGLAIVNFFMMPYLVLLPFYVDDILKLTSDWYGFIMSTFGVGTLAGYLCSGSFLNTAQRRQAAVLLGLPAMSVAFGLLGVLSNVYGILVCFFVGGAFTGVYNIQLITLTQLNTPPGKRGRMMGLLTTLGTSLSPLGMAASGFLSDLLNHDVRLIFLSTAVILVCLTTTLAFNGHYRRFLLGRADTK